ncbi:MAG: alpha/beta hydrolase [Ferruginibacter sp.]
MRGIFIAAQLLFICFLTSGQSKSFEVKVVGNGQPLILIPGYSCSGEVWNETVAHLRDKYECHVVTLAGYAGVAPVDTPILKTVKEDLIKYIKEKKLKHVILMGHSLGAFMSIWIGSEIPASIEKIICVDGLPAIAAMMNPAINYDSLRRSPSMNAEMVANNFKAIPTQNYIENAAKAMLYQVSDSARARQIATWSSLCDRKTLGYTLVEISATDLRAEMKKITCPVLILASTYGTAENSNKVMNEQYANLPNKKIMVAASKHFIMYDAPEWMYKQVDEFLK